jgi:Mn-dependent DtxR family transcriptional regulator
MAKQKYTHEMLSEVYDLIDKNPYITYAEIEEKLYPQKVNANSIVKQLQRMGCIKTERHVDGLSGKIRGSKKICVRLP